ncbi:histidine-phosphotransfer domain HPT domain-containing protein [Mycena vitilis]|nr:histidine-phosphotransfer domain HPT domain-containing protein [Mycena vitilis]
MADDAPRPRASPPPSTTAAVKKVKPAKPDDPATPKPPPTPVPEPVPDPPADDPADAEAIDMSIFSQILELDEDGTHEFSKEMVVAYFSQASTTFDDMDNALAAKKLPELSALGHFLKGSSAALGICKVQAACEKMQHYGDLRDEAAGKDLNEDDALAKIDALLVEVKTEYADAERWLKKWYADQKDPFDEPTPA